MPRRARRNGASPVTVLELADRLARVRPDVRLVGVEIDPERVARGVAVADPPRVEFVLGGISQRMADSIREEMDALGIVKPKDAETAQAAPGEAVTPDGYANGAVVAETPTEISRLTVPEAVMRLDLSQEPVLMFRNRGTGVLNVVYRRADGHVGWIDPQKA